MSTHCAQCANSFNIYTGFGFHFNPEQWGKRNENKTGGKDFDIFLYTQYTHIYIVFFLLALKLVSRLFMHFVVALGRIEIWIEKCEKSERQIGERIEP